MKDCMKCKYASLAYDDAYGATIWYVEGCKREGNCPYGNDREEDDE